MRGCGRGNAERNVERVRACPRWVATKISYGRHKFSIFSPVFCWCYRYDRCCDSVFLFLFLSFFAFSFSVGYDYVLIHRFSKKNPECTLHHFFSLLFWGLEKKRGKSVM
ncbi:hypothetical protein, unlikely [Trypanosoma brucei gambiense DAL972]|uniref:Uncharacterized protein n=1 Tax=Trypanosoma brucei gambiense (strain MHOM/CI/86/DAL972) TaxID=679716 RepID=C9ZNC8_TRYB9|nr:hypothetical protein, unlikely [Trypanosoma brucei gambiense DAL972]CBH10906.1 hypothetical protein, unlikely [Trypanosoma brucei gambiense DAL972]|eukprot:XP_011773193.1 hypothetical protein, unlikely [Trypanosoma brucei gambiense DAL972]